MVDPTFKDLLELCMVEQSVVKWIQILSASVINMMGHVSFSSSVGLSLTFMVGIHSHSPSKCFSLSTFI